MAAQRNPTRPPRCDQRAHETLNMQRRTCCSCLAKLQGATAARVKAQCQHSGSAALTWIVNQAIQQVYRFHRATPLPTASLAMRTSYSACGCSADLHTCVAPTQNDPFSSALWATLSGQTPPVVYSSLVHGKLGRSLCQVIVCQQADCSMAACGTGGHACKRVKSICACATQRAEGANPTLKPSMAAAQD